jgi:hypothetical protein
VSDPETIILTYPEDDYVLSVVEVGDPETAGYKLLSSASGGHDVSGDADAWGRIVKDLDLAVKCREATLAMAVARLGEEVEGAPTYRGNFLQRIDALRAIEAETREALLQADELSKGSR